MDTQRLFGQELDQNVPRGQNLSTKQRDQIVGRLATGATLQECADTYGCTRRCVCDLWKKYHQTGTTKDKPCSDRPPILSLRQKKIIYCKACAQPKIEFKALAEVGVLVNSDGTPTKPR
jgi:transposase